MCESSCRSWSLLHPSRKHVLTCPALFPSTVAHLAWHMLSTSTSCSRVMLAQTSRFLLSGTLDGQALQQPPGCISPTLQFAHGCCATLISESNTSVHAPVGCRCESTQTIHSIARNFPNLESVDVSDVAGFTPAVLTSWSRQLERLTRLVAQRCTAQSLHLPACPFPRLVHLDLKGCRALDCSHLVRPSPKQI